MNFTTLLQMIGLLKKDVRGVEQQVKGVDSGLSSAKQSLADVKMRVTLLEQEARNMQRQHDDGRR